METKSPALDFTINEERLELPRGDAGSSTTSTDVSVEAIKKETLVTEPPTGHNNENVMMSLPGHSKSLLETLLAANSLEDIRVKLEPVEVDIKEEPGDPCLPSGLLGAIDAGQPYECATCGFKCAKQPAFRQHLKLHTTPMEFKCKLCDKKFGQKLYLARHLKTHTRERPFQCHICNNKFSARSSLVRHVKMHTGDTPYRCEMCDWKFSVKCMLTRHLKVHIGEKPFQCSTCLQKFAAESTLAKHMQIHADKQVFHCPICRRNFSLRSRLVNHLKVHNGKKTL